MNILLVCSAGMSTSMIVKKMQDEAKSQNIEAHIEASPEGQVNSKLENLDVILIGPQVRYLEKKLKKLTESTDIKVDIIDPKAYGMIQGDKILQQAIDLKMSNKG